MCDVVMWATALIVQSRGAGRVGVENSCWPGTCLSLLVCVLHLVSSTHIVCVEVEDSALCDLISFFQHCAVCALLLASATPCYVRQIPRVHLLRAYGAIGLHVPRFMLLINVRFVHIVFLLQTHVDLPFVLLACPCK